MSTFACTRVHMHMHTHMCTREPICACDAMHTHAWRVQAEVGGGVVISTRGRRLAKRAAAQWKVLCARLAHVYMSQHPNPTPAVARVRVRRAVRAGGSAGRLAAQAAAHTLGDTLRVGAACSCMHIRGARCLPSTSTRIRPRHRHSSTRRRRRGERGVDPRQWRASTARRQQTRRRRAPWPGSASAC